MPKLSLQRKDVPFLFGGNGQLSLETGDLKLNQPLDAGTTNLLNATFDASASPTITLNGDDTIKLGVTAKTAVELIPIFSYTQIP